jgi:hypothetical protein
LLKFLRGMASDRKFQLFAVTQCRRLSHWFNAPANTQAAARLRRLLDVGERDADGLAGPAELREAEQVAYDLSEGGWGDAREIGTPFQHPEDWAARTLATNCVPARATQAPSSGVVPPNTRPPPWSNWPR